MDTQTLQAMMQLSDISNIDMDTIYQLKTSMSDCVLSVDYGLLSTEQFERPTELVLPGVACASNRRLVKYYSNRCNADGRNYSMESLLGNTVHISPPSRFNDPFDCLPGFDRQRAHAVVAQWFIDAFGLKIQAGDETDVDGAIADSLNALSPDDLPRVPHINSSSSMLKPFLTYQHMYLCSCREGRISRDAVWDAFESEIEGALALLRKCRVACFTGSPTNAYMWAHYAADHTGFCIEYDPPTDDGKLEDRASWLLSNIYGVFYHMRRPDCTDLLLTAILREYDPESLSFLFAKLLCSKGLDWAFEQESRLIVLDHDAPDEIAFFPIKRVYLGARMPEHSKAVIAKALEGKDVELFSMRLSDATYSLVAEKYEPGN